MPRRESRPLDRGQRATRLGPGTAAHAAAAHGAGEPWKDAAVFAVIALCALVLRLIYIWQLSRSPLFAHPQVDELYHDQWAQAIVAGRPFVDGPYFRAPLYPAFLAAIYAVFGHDYLAPRIVQAVLGSLNCGLLFLIGRYTFGRAVGAVAGFLAAGYWMLIYHDGELLITTLIVFLDLLLIGLLLYAARTPGVVWYGLAGIVLGLSAIARPDILPFAPAIVLWLLVVHRRQRRRALAGVASVTAGCLAVILPITVRNYVAGHDQVLIASQGGVNFYIGNNPQANGWAAIVPGLPNGWWETYHAASAQAEAARGRNLKPSEVSQYYYERAGQFIRQQPGRFLALLGRKFSLFWSCWEISNDKNIYFWTERFTPLVKGLPLGFGVVGPFGILGLILCWRRRVELFPLWGFVLVYMATVVSFFCNARFRLPVLAPLLLLAVHAGFAAATAIRRAQWKRVLGGLGVLSLAGVLVNSTPGSAEFRYDPHDYLTLGNAYQAQERLDLAADSFRKALALNPEFLTAHFKLGSLLAMSGQLPEGIAELRRALTTRPRLQANETDETLAAVHTNLGSALAKSGAEAEAIEHYQAALRLAPRGQQRDALFNLGMLLGGAGRTGEAIDALRQVVVTSPDDREARLWLARRLIEAERADEAVGQYREILRTQPSDADALYELAGALFAQGKDDEALVPLREYVQLRPNDPQVLDRVSSALLRVGRYAEARDLLRAALPLKNPWLTNRLAFLLAACPDDAVRDGAAALRYAQQLCPKVESCEPAYLDTLAAALAETGRYAEAASRAREALAGARASPRPADRAQADAVAERLRLYEAGRPYRLPHP